MNDSTTTWSGSDFNKNALQFTNYVFENNLELPRFWEYIMENGINFLHTKDFENNMELCRFWKCILENCLHCGTVWAVWIKDINLNPDLNSNVIHP